MTRAAVSDTGPLIHLAEIESLHLLAAFERLLIPERVHKEIERGTVPEELSDLSFGLVEAENLHQAEELDTGERAALAVAREYGVVLLTDDLAAREAATTADIEVHGSIGVIALGYGRGLLERDEAATLMRALQRETSLFVTEAVVERGIEMLENQ